MARELFVSVCAALCLQLALCQFGFFPQREDRGFNVFGAVQNILENPRRTLQAVLNFGPDRNNQYRPGVIHGPSYDQYGRPNYPNYNPNEYYYNNIKYPNRDFNNGRDVVFEPTDNPFQDNLGLNGDNYPNQGFTTRRPKENFINENNVPSFGTNNNIPSTDSNQENNNEQNNEFGTNNIPDVPPYGTDVNNPQFGSENTNNGIPDTPPGGLDNTNGIPTVPPFGIEENINGIPNTPFGSENANNGIPNVPPSGFGDKNLGTPDTPPVADISSTTLAPLTPVPNTGSRNNLNFGSEGLFLETCETEESGVGSCINLYRCEPYLKLLTDKQRPPSTTALLKKVHCGFEGNTPKVCCPRPGIPTVPPTQAPATETTQPPTTQPPRPSGKSLTDGDYVDAFPQPPVCGTSSAQFTKVVGGVNAKLGDFPWMALLGYKDRGGPSVSWKCGGSLITSRHVLTAAHCISGLDTLYLVRLGELDLEREDDGAAPVDVLIKTKIEHEAYSRNSLSNDIGLLVLQQDVTFTKLIHPICIPLAPELRSNSYVNYNPLIAGWGSLSYRGPSASHLQALQLPVVSNDYCARVYEPYKEQTVIDERVLCAGYEQGGRDACQGDSGGPLMQPVWNSKNFTTPMYQIGVVSYGKKCAEPGFPGVYTRVTQFIPWLEEKVLGKA